MKIGRRANSSAKLSICNQLLDFYGDLRAIHVCFALAVSCTLKKGIAMNNKTLTEVSRMTREQKHDYIRELARRQSVKPLERIEDLQGDFWPEEEAWTSFWLGCARFVNKIPSKHHHKQGFLIKIALVST